MVEDHLRDSGDRESGLPRQSTERGRMAPGVNRWPMSPRIEVRHCVTFTVRHYECRLDLPPLPYSLSNSRGEPGHETSRTHVKLPIVHNVDRTSFLSKYEPIL